MTQPMHVESQPPLEVVIKGSERPVAYACPTCGLLFLLSKDDTEEERARKMEDASAHCNKTCICGKPLDHYKLRCFDCQLQLQAEKEKARFEKSEKLALEDYDGPVYWEGHEGGLGDGYFSGIDEVLDYCESEGVSVPHYVWACSSSEFKLSAEDMIERELERQEMYDEAGEGISDDARKQLQEFLDAWAKEQHIVGWLFDHRRSVILRDASDSTPPSGQVGRSAN